MMKGWGINMDAQVLVAVFTYGLFFGVSFCRLIDLFHYFDDKRRKEEFKEKLKEQKYE